MKVLRKIIFVPFIVYGQLLTAQNYQAVHGSSYAGSLAPANNPASIVYVPYAWDLTPIAVQAKQSTNAVKINKYSLLSSPKNITAVAVSGTINRYLLANQNIRLLNTRISLNSTSAIAFGASIKNYISVSASKTNWQDTLPTLYDFLDINAGNKPLSASLTENAWAEFYATYAHTIVDDGFSMLNAGLTVKLNRSVAGAFALANDLNYAPTIAGNKKLYELTSGSLQYGYSANFDRIDSNQTAAANRQKFLQQGFYNAGADIGLEYIILTDEDKPEGGDYAHNTKIGISLLDLGYNRYQSGSRSRIAVAGKKNINDTIIETKFSALQNADEFIDSLGSISESLEEISGDFFIYQPARIVVNIDKHIIHNFFINAELTLPLTGLSAKNTLYIKDMNLLAVTPRWELQSVGVYMPILFNSRNQFWMGGALKAGPLLLGTHNLANLFSKNKMQNGGIYLAVTVRPGKHYDRTAHYPKEKNIQERYPKTSMSDVVIFSFLLLNF